MITHEEGARMLRKVLNSICKISMRITVFFIIFLALHSLLKDVIKIPAWTMGRFYAYELIPLLVAVLAVVFFVNVSTPFDVNSATKNQ